MEASFLWLKGNGHWGKDVFSATLDSNTVGSSAWWSAPYGEMVYSIALGSKGLYYVFNKVDTLRAIKGPGILYHYKPPVSGNGSPLPAPEPTYDPPLSYYHHSWTEYIDIRTQSGHEVLFFSGRYEADNLTDCFNISAIYRIVEIEREISEGEWPIPPYPQGTPYHTIHGSDFPLPPSEPGGPPVINPTWLGSPFTFDDDDGLYISHGCGPSGIFLISQAGSTGVSGQTVKIYEDQSNIAALRSYGPGILFFLSSGGGEGWKIYELDLVTPSSPRVVYSTADDPAFVDVLDFTLVPPTEAMMARLNIQWIQRTLNRILGCSLSTDGVYGGLTQEAVRQFQENYGLTPDGIVGARTRKKIIEQIRELL